MKHGQSVALDPVLCRRACTIALCAWGATLGAGVPAQQSYPAKVIRMVIPLPPGGTSDILARIAAQKITEATGQPVIAENRGGAGGNIGTEIVAKAPPDGYTLLTAPGSTLTVNPSLYRNPSVFQALDQADFHQPSHIAMDVLVVFSKLQRDHIDAERDVLLEQREVAVCFFRLPPWLSSGDLQVFHFLLQPLPSRPK